LIVPSKEGAQPGGPRFATSQVRGRHRIPVIGYAVTMQDGMDRLAGVRMQDHEGARARVLHNLGGCGLVVVLVCRREWWPHDVRDDGGVGG